MSQETNHGIKPAVMEDEHKSGEGCATNNCDKGNPVERCFPRLDGHEFPGGSHLVGESESMQVEESTVTRSHESFQSLYSSQSSEEGVKRGENDSLCFSYQRDWGSLI